MAKKDLDLRDLIFKRLVFTRLQTGTMGKGSCIGPRIVMISRRGVWGWACRSRYEGWHTKYKYNRSYWWVSFSSLKVQPNFFFQLPPLHRWLEIAVLLDSGAKEHMIDKALVRKLGIPPRSCSKTLWANTLNGRLLTSGKEMTLPVTLLISANQPRSSRLCLQQTQASLWGKKASTSSLSDVSVMNWVPLSVIISSF